MNLHALMSIRFVYKWRWVLKPFVSYHCWIKSWWGENGTFTTAHFCLTVFHDAFEWVLQVVKSLKDVHWALHWASNAFMVELHSLCIVYIACQHHPYIESLPTLWYVLEVSLCILQDCNRTYIPCNPTQRMLSFFGGILLYSYQSDYVMWTPSMYEGLLQKSSN